MKILFLKKILYLTLMLFIISLISFLVIHLAPNSFFASGELNPNITKEAIEELKAIYGLDKPLLIQYLSWLKAMVVFDFGISFVSGQKVSEEILSRLPITLIINIISMIFIYIISLYLGIKSAFNKDRYFDKRVKEFALFSYAMPSFYLALLLILLFAVNLKIFPISGLHSLDQPTGVFYYLDEMWHLFLPIFVIIIGGVGSLSLYIRNLTIDILKSDYIFFAKSRGVKDKELFKYFILPNLSPPIITILGLSLPSLIGGSVILETIFSIDGMGLLFYRSALSHDYPVIMGILIISAFLTLLGNILADITLILLNPHFKRKNR